MEKINADVIYDPSADYSEIEEITGYLDCRGADTMTQYRYTYHNKLYFAMGGEHGLLCNPVRDARGKCIVGRGSQLVDFKDGNRCVVIRRCLRLYKRCDRKRRLGGGSSPRAA